MKLCLTLEPRSKKVQFDNTGVMFVFCSHPGIRVLALRRRQIHSPQRAAQSFDPSLQRSQNGDRGGRFDRWPPGIHDLLEEQVSLLKTAHRRSLADILHSHEGPSKWTQKYSLSCKFTFNKQAGQFCEMQFQEWKKRSPESNLNKQRCKLYSRKK